MMKPLDDENTYITSATSPSKETARPHRSRPILHLFLEREDASNDINKDTDKPSYLVTSESNRDELSSKDENRHDSKKDEQGESIIQKFRPMLQLFFDREKEKKLNVAPSNDSRKGTAPNGRSSESASIKNDKQSTRSSDDDDSVWKSYRRNTLSRNDSGDHSKIAPSSTTLRRRSSVGIASSTISDENISLETFSLGSLKDKSEKSNTGHRAITTAERKSPWYKNKMFLIFGCLLVIVLFCLFSAIPLVRKKNATSTSTSLSYNQQNHEGTKDATGSTSSQQTLPSKQPSPTTNQVPTNMPQTNVGGTKPTTGNVAVPSNIIKTPTKSPVSVPIKSPVVAPMKAPVSAPTKVPMVAPTKAPVSVPTKSPVTVPTNVVKPSSIQASTTDCFLTSEVACTDALNPSLSCTTLISNWKNKGSIPCVSVNIRYNYRICNMQSDASALLNHATGKVNGIQTTDLTQLGKNTVMNPGECRNDFRTWSGKVFCFDGLIQNQSYASLWIQGVSSKGSNCTDFNKFIYSSI